MMLRIVRAKLEQPMPPFAQFYINYIMQIQDRAIEAELRPMLRINNVNTIGLLIDREAKEVRKGELNDSGGYNTVSIQ